MWNINYFLVKDRDIQDYKVFPMNYNEKDSIPEHSASNPLQDTQNFYQEKELTRYLSLPCKYLRKRSDFVWKARKSGDKETQQKKICF